MDFEAAAKEFTRSAEGAEGDTAMARKRSRRVSFADTTAIHVFDRDEDYDTPPDLKPGAEGSSGAGLGSEPLGFYVDFTHNEDARSPSRREEDGDDHEEQDGGEEEHQLFVRRDADSSSPGSTAGSVMSNDDDNLFGPVSTSFIRSGRLSEVSDDNDHDITLDSTAFSMHFSNILPSDDQSVSKGGTPRTPTEDYVAKDCGAFVPFSGTKRKVLDFTLPNGKSSGVTGYSSDMTLVAENSSSYDYEKLPPTLEVLLAEVNEAMQPQNQNDMSSLLSCSPNMGTGPPAGASTDKIEQAIFSPMLNAKDATHKAELPNLVPGNASDIDIISLPNEQSQKCYSFPQDHMPISHLKDGTRENESCSNFSHLSASDVPTHVTPDAVQIASESECKTQTPTGIQNGNQQTCSPLGSSISSLLTKRRQLFDDAAASVSLQSRSRMQTSNSLKRKIALNSEGTSIIKNSVSKFETFEVEESLGSRSRFHGFKAALDDSGNYNCTTPLNTSLSRVGEQVISIAGEVSGLEMNSKMHIHGHETPSSSRKSGWNEEGWVNTETNKETEVMIQIPGAGVQKVEKSLRSENPEEGASSPILNSAKQKTFDVKENRQLLNTFSKLVSSPMSLMGQKHSVTQDQCFTPLASGSIISNSLLKEVRSEMPLFSVTSSIIQTRKQGNQNVTSEARTVSQVTEKESVVSSRNLSPVGQDRDYRMRKVPDNMTEKIAGGRPAVPDASKVMTMKESEQLMTYRSPVRVLDYIEDNDISKTFHLRNAGCRDSMNKRRSEEVHLANDVSNVPGRTSKNLMVMSDIKANIAAFSPAQQRQHIVGDNGAVGHLVWTGLLEKIIEVTKEPFSLSVNKLTLLELDVLEDLVGELQKARKFERLCSDVQTLGKCHDLGQQKRLSDIKLLKETLLYEQAKLQLKSIKRDRLLKRTHDLQSRIHDFCQLRSSFKQMIDKPSCLPVPDPNIMVQDEHDKVLSTKQELKILDEKIKGFVNFFGTSCKIDTSLGFDEMTKVICDILDKRNHNRVIHQHLQLWKLIDVMNQNDQYDIIINYCNLLSQRFTIKVTPSTRFGVEVSLDDAKIEKSFPNIKVSTAFRFIFNGTEGHKRLASVRCFQRETQATSFILGNLLDVLEEIQISQIENPNLMSSTFCAQSAGKLELQLHFLDIKSGKMVALSLDMTHLNCGVYPSDPSELKIGVSSSNSALSPSVADEIIGAIRSLKTGHLLLTRLCRCVSQLIQSPKMQQYLRVS